MIATEIRAAAHAAEWRHSTNLHDWPPVRANEAALGAQDGLVDWDEDDEVAD